MTIRQAALLAFIGTILVAAISLWNLGFNVVSVTRGLVPADVIFSSLVYTFASCSAAVFFFACHRQL